MLKNATTDATKRDQYLFGAGAPGRVVLARGAGDHIAERVAVAVRRLFVGRQADVLAAHEMVTACTFAQAHSDRQTMHEKSMMR